MKIVLTVAQNVAQSFIVTFSLSDAGVTRVHGENNRHVT